MNKWRTGRIFLGILLPPYGLYLLLRSKLVWWLKVLLSFIVLVVSVVAVDIVNYPLRDKESLIYAAISQQLQQLGIDESFDLTYESRGVGYILDEPTPVFIYSVKLPNDALKVQLFSRDGLAFEVVHVDVLHASSQWFKDAIGEWSLVKVSEVTAAFAQWLYQKRMMEFHLESGHQYGVTLTIPLEEKYTLAIREDQQKIILKKGWVHEWSINGEKHLSSTKSPYDDKITAWLKKTPLAGKSFTDVTYERMNGADYYHFDVSGVLYRIEEKEGMVALQMEVHKAHDK